MKNLKISAIIFAMLSVLFFNCDNESIVQKSYIYAETQCSDSWDSSEDDILLSTAVQQYLESLQVLVLNVEVVDSIAPAQICLACDCLTGRGIRVRSTEEYEATLLAEGFEEEE